MKTSDKKEFIEFTSTGIHYSFRAKYKKEDNGMLSWYIPSYGIYFSSQNFESGERRALAMTYSFFKYWLKHESHKHLIAELYKLGYSPISETPMTALIEFMNDKSKIIKMKSVRNEDSERFKDYLEINKENIYKRAS